MIMVKQLQLDQPSTDNYIWTKKQNQKTKKANKNFLEALESDQSYHKLEDGQNLEQGEYSR